MSGYMEINQFIEAVNSTTQRGSHWLYFKTDSVTQKTVDVLVGRRNFFYQQYMRCRGYICGSHPSFVLSQVCSVSEAFGIPRQQFESIFELVCKRLNANSGCSQFLRIYNWKMAETARLSMTESETKTSQASFVDLVEQTFKKEKISTEAITILKEHPLFPTDGNGYNIILSYLTKDLSEVYSESSLSQSLAKAYQDSAFHKFSLVKNDILSPKLFDFIVDIALQETGTVPDESVLLRLGQVAVEFNDSKLLEAILRVSESLLRKLLEYSVENRFFMGLKSLLKAGASSSVDLLQMIQIACKKEDLILLKMILKALLFHPKRDPSNYQNELLQLQTDLLSTIQGAFESKAFQKKASDLLSSERIGLSVF